MTAACIPSIKYGTKLNFLMDLPQVSIIRIYTKYIALSIGTLSSELVSWLYSVVHSVSHLHSVSNTVNPSLIKAECKRHSNQIKLENRKPHLYSVSPDPNTSANMGLPMATMWKSLIGSLCKNLIILVTHEWTHWRYSPTPNDLLLMLSRSTFIKFGFSRKHNYIKYTLCWYVCF